MDKAEALRQVEHILDELDSSAYEQGKADMQPEIEQAKSKAYDDGYEKGYADGEAQGRAEPEAEH